MRRWLAVWTMSGLMLALGPTLSAQSGDPAAELSRQGSVLFDQNKYQEAAAVYGNILRSYPNSTVAPDAQLRLAYCSFFTGQYQPAIDALKKLIGTPATPANVQELASALLPQALSQQGASLKPGDRKRRAAFDAAIAEYGNFLQKFPRSPEIEHAVYGRAVVNYQNGKFDDTEKDLRQNIANFPDSESTDDSAYLLALTLDSQANALLADPAKAEPNAPAAIKKYDEARKLLEAIVSRRVDLALANDAHFQLGQTLLARSAAGPAEADQSALLNQALAEFRAVEPKEPILAIQNARVYRLRELRANELRKGGGADLARVARYESFLLREQSKLAELQTKEDTTLSARLQSGAVFYQLKRYDETRVLMNALAPVADRPEEEKVVLYYTVLSYANQGVTGKAVTFYDQFQAKYAGDPMAENLPLVMGNLFLTSDQPDAEKAGQYFAEFAKRYPKSKLRGVASIQEAAAAAALKRYGDALNMLNRFLRSSPQPDLAAAAELASARIRKDMADFPKASAAFYKIIEKYPNRPEAEESTFWIGWIKLQQGDAPGALKSIQGFLDKYPQSKLVSNALLTRAQALQATHAKDQAIKTLDEVSRRAPDGPEMAGVVFQRANIYLSEKKLDMVAKTLGDFIDQHPEDPQAFAACDRLASIQAQNGQWDQAASTFQKFLDRQTDSPDLAEALGKLAGVWQRAARSLGPYVALSAAQRDAWIADINNSVAVSERQLETFPEAPATALGLQNLFDCQQLLLDAKIKNDSQVAEYFLNLAERYDDKPAPRSRALFLVAALMLDKDPAKARADMAAAYDPNVIYSPTDLDRYGEALLANKDFDAAQKVFKKLAADYPNPRGAAPGQAPPEVQQAQAIALYGNGKIAELQLNPDEAIKAYETLKKNYPRSAKVPAANLGLAQCLVNKGRAPDALPLLAEVARSPAVPLENRAKGMFLNGFVLQQLGKPDAIDTYLKVAVFYPTTPQAAEGLWTGAQLLEQQGNNLPDKTTDGGPTKGGQLAKARKIYETLVSRYADSQWAEKARQRLASFPATASN